MKVGEILGMLKAADYALQTAMDEIPDDESVNAAWEEVRDAQEATNKAITLLRPLHKEENI